VNRHFGNPKRAASSSATSLLLALLAASRTDFERPFVGFAIYFCLAGVLLHGIARAGARVGSSS
jgi:hypothetical protein